VGLTGNLIWKSIGATVSGCTDARKCEYYIPCVTHGYNCIPAIHDCNYNYCGVKKEQCIQKDLNCAYDVECNAANIAVCESHTWQCDCNEGTWQETTPQ
jgi:hypothetical protein